MSQALISVYVDMEGLMKYREGEQAQGQDERTARNTINLLVPEHEVIGSTRASSVFPSGGSRTTFTFRKPTVTGYGD